MKTIFRTNAGKEGLGHLNRIFSLYTAISCYDDFEGLFLVNKLAKQRLIELGISKDIIYISEKYKSYDIDFFKKYNPDIIIIDTYKASNQYISKINKKFSSLLVLFDDNALYKGINIDFLINGNVFADKLNYMEKISFKHSFLGPKYLVMNPDYWDVEINISNEISTILVTCGGADPNDIMNLLVKWLKYEDLKKKIIIGPYFNEFQIKKFQNIIDDSFELIQKPLSLKQHILTSDIVLTTSGSTVYEALRLRKIPIIYSSGEDQNMVAEELEKRGVINLGWFENLTQEKLKFAINKSKDKKYRLTLEKLYSLFDGKGTIRIAKEIIVYYKNKKGGY